MSMGKFANLDVTSAFSFLWGTFTPEELAKKAKSAGQDAVALTDIWGTYGIPKLYRACRKQGIRCIPGARVRIYGHGWVVLLARDITGYRNLCRLVSMGLSSGNRKSRYISVSAAKEHAEGLICITSVAGSEARDLAVRGNIQGAGIKLLALKYIFREKDTLFVGIQNNCCGDDAANTILLQHARSLGLSPAAINHTVFLAPEEYHVHEMFTDIQRRHHHRDVHCLPNSSFHFCTAAHMRQRAIPAEAIETAGHIAEMCSGFSFPSGKFHPPSFMEKHRADRKLSRRAVRTLARTRRIAPHRYIILLQKELETIKARGLSDFFLLVHDICSMAENHGIRHSIRGSAAGSLLVHLLHGGPDPVFHNLLFERFINDGRQDLPDIDIDFDSKRRDEVTEWLIRRCQRKGRRGITSQAALVATISTFRTRSAVRLAARAMGYPLAEIERLSRCLPWSLRGIPLAEAVETLPELEDSPLRHEKSLLTAASRIEGLPFQPSVHLGGVILAPDDITAWSAVSICRKGLPVAHLDKRDVEILGLLKLDLLGLRMHTAMRKSLEALEHQGIHVDIDHLPLNDPATFELIRSCETLGVFQIESSGQRNLVGRLQPRDFNDITVEISLFRPGPVQGDMVNRYLKRRHGHEHVDFIHPDLKDILADTFGVIVFQEQVLRIVKCFAGFSYADADAFRRAMTKGRSTGEMKRLKHAFIQGAVRKGHQRQCAEKVYERIAAFAAYGFCQSHAVAFANITWQTAWLKAHHPREFYTGLLNAGHVGSYPPFVILNEARRNGIPTLRPHVNRSSSEYVPEGNGIRCPLHVIRGIGMKTQDKILSERKVNGSYTGWDDFFARVQLPIRTRYMVIFSGALKGLATTGQAGRLSMEDMDVDLRVA